MEEATDMDEGQALMRGHACEKVGRHGRGPDIDEGPCMMEAVTDMEEGQAW